MTKIKNIIMQIHRILAIFLMFEAFAGEKERPWEQSWGITTSSALEKQNVQANK